MYFHAYMYMYSCIIIISMDCVYTIQCQTMTGMHQTGCTVRYLLLIASSMASLMSLDKLMMIMTDDDDI